MKRTPGRGGAAAAVGCVVYCTAALLYMVHALISMVRP